MVNGARLGRVGLGMVFLTAAACSQGNATADRATPVAASAEAEDAPPPVAAPGDGAHAAATADSLAPAASAPGPRAAAEASKSTAAPITGVKSGEWDDNANYRDFLGYVKASPIGAKLDVTKRRFVAVRDKDGRAVPNCEVALTHGDVTTKLVTTSTGRALFFPAVERMTQGRVSAHASCAGEGEVSIDLASQDGLVEIETAGARDLGDDRTVDIVFVLDTTGSMSEEIAALVASIEKVTDMLEKEKVTARFGFVEYKDRGDTPRVKAMPFTRDVRQLMGTLRALSASGGGDYPEDMNEGLRVAIDDLKWDKESVARLVFVIGDAPPQLGYQDSKSFEQSAVAANHAGIVIHTVAASGMDELGQSVFRQVSQVTGGSTMFVLRGGAGSASAGGGDPKRSCGGTHQSFKSGDLHQLISNKVYAAISAPDRSPLQVAGLGQDEDAKPCEQRVAPVVWQAK